MALSAAEKKELDELRKRAESAEKTVEEATAANSELRTANENLATANDGLVTANDGLVTANDGLVTANDGLVTANDVANVKIAQAAIDQREAVDEAVEAKEAEMQSAVKRAKDGTKDKSFSPKEPPAFDKGEYFSECFGSDVAFAQNGWFYNNSHKPVRPINKPT